MLSLILDIETTPIDESDRRSFPRAVHCIVARDADTGDVYTAGPGELADAVEFLETADRLIGHDLARFDLPVIRHHFPRFRFAGEIFDTLAAARLVYASNLYERSLRWQREAEKAGKPVLPSGMLRAHKLEAWGYRLGVPKMHADVDVSFYEKYSPELLDRCVSDVAITAALYKHLLTEPAEKGWPLCSVESLLNESRVSEIVGEQERNGVGFDAEAAVLLFAELSEAREKVERELRSMVAPWIAPKGKPVVPKRSRVCRKGFQWPVHFTAGAEYQPIQVVEFNPASGLHRWLALSGREERTRAAQAEHLLPGPDGYGWRPVDFTPEGQAVTDEETLADLQYPLAEPLRRYLLLNKRLGQLSDGQQAWMRTVQHGRIHGGVIPTGPRTSRAAHVRPNLGQVPKCTSPYGPECRALFRPTRAGWVQGGVDVQGLELRLFAARLAEFDGGAFIELVLKGDPHAAFMVGTQIFIRDNQKTWTYAFLYGAGDYKLGCIILEDWRMAFERGLADTPPPGLEYAAGLGAVSRKRLLRHFGALDDLLEKCRKNYKAGRFIGLDGRVLASPSAHGALNDVLQSDGAILTKHAMPIWRDRLEQRLGPPGERWAPMLWVHDEWQHEAEMSVGHVVGEILCESVAAAGLLLGIPWPMAGEFKIGENWRETH